MKKQKKLTVLLMLIVMIITTLLPVTTAGAASYTDEEILLARVIQMEGGTDTELREAIASVVINRLNNPAWNDDTISEVIYHKNQFSVVNSSKFKTLEPKEANLTVARRIIKNGAAVPGIEYFKSSSSSKGTLKMACTTGGTTLITKQSRATTFIFPINSPMISILYPVVPHLSLSIFLPKVIRLSKEIRSPVWLKI